MEFLETFDNIEEKVKLLASKVEHIQQENASLKQENELLRKQLSEQNESVEELQDKVEAHKRIIAQNAELQPDDPESLKERIDQYITEIDKCIEWLNNN